MPPLDLSLGALVGQATGVVQAVLAILAACSIVCWAVILEKAALLRRYKRQAGRFEAFVRGRAAGFTPAGASTLPDNLPDNLSDALPAALLAEGRLEWGTARPGESAGERRERIETAMRDALAATLLRAESRLPYLATIGSAAPFIGLFGTVWGIMHAFVSIAQTNDTSLAVVAPGIAESLFTTAVGLAAAIPASIAYNKLAADFGGLSRRLSLAIATLARRAPDPEAGHEAA